MRALRVACLGDSLTYGYGVRREESWVELAGRELAPEMALCNHGLNGDTTAGMRERLTAEILPARPDAVLLMGGANDIAFAGGAAPARANLPDMVRGVRDGGALPLIGIPLPYIPSPREEWGSFEHLLKNATEYDEYALWLRGFCASEGIRTVDFRARFEAETGQSGHAPDGYFFDGLHFNAEGHRLLAACMAENMRTLLAEGVLTASGA